MRVAVLGTGYVGLTTACCLAELGYDVAGYDVDAGRIAAVRRGQVPFTEPGLDVLLARHLGSRLRFTLSLTDAAAADMLFICVGTPPRHNGEPDLQYLDSLAGDLTAVLSGERMVVTKSTVPVGTNRRLAARLAGAGTGIRVLSNPEFLREGSAVSDFFHPDRVVIGGDPAAAQALADMFRPLQAPVLTTSWEAAELAKYAANAYLATRLTFVNELANLCYAVGVDVRDVTRAMGMDHRIGPYYLNPGPGYGGSCLPKDVAALRWQARQHGVDMELLSTASRVNRRQRRWLVDRLAEGVGDLAGKTVAVWGLAFKAGTDDLRGAPALDVVPELIRRGAAVRAHDPAAGDEAGQIFARQGLAGVTVCDDQWQAAAGAQALLILTEWPQYRVTPAQLSAWLDGRLVVDARNLLEPHPFADAGFVYSGMGRRAVNGDVASIVGHMGARSPS